MLLSLAFSLIPIQSLAANRNVTSMYVQLEQLDHVVNMAFEKYSHGATDREILEVYYQAGYITQHNIDEILQLSDSNTLLSNDVEIGDILEIDITINRATIVNAATGLAGIMLDMIGLVNPPAVIAGAIFSCASLILNHVNSTAGDYKSVTVTGAFIYQYNPDNFTRQWMPYIGLEFTVSK